MRKVVNNLEYIYKKQAHLPEDKWPYRSLTQRPVSRDIESGRDYEICGECGGVGHYLKEVKRSNRGKKYVLANCEVCK